MRKEILRSMRESMKPDDSVVTELFTKLRHAPAPKREHPIVKSLPILVSACVIIIACVVAYPIFMVGDVLPPEDAPGGSTNGEPREDNEPTYDEKMLLQAWAKYYHYTYKYDASLFLQSEAYELLKHYGFWGEGNYDVVTIHGKGWFVDFGSSSFNVAGNLFQFQNSGLHYMMVFTGETFLTLEEAFIQELLSISDITALVEISRHEYDLTLPLREAYAAYMNLRTGVAHAVWSADDISIEYYGVYGGYEVAELWFGESRLSYASMPYVVADYAFGGFRNIMVLTGDNPIFLSLKEAYEQGLLSKDDIAALHKDHFDYWEQFTPDDPDPDPAQNPDPPQNPEKPVINEAIQSLIGYVETIDTIIGIEEDFEISYYHHSNPGEWLQFFGVGVYIEIDGVIEEYEIRENYNDRTLEIICYRTASHAPAPPSDALYSKPLANGANFDKTKAAVYPYR